MWRYRGGRDGHETLQQFMSFISNDVESELVPMGNNNTAYPGVAVFVIPYSLGNEFELDKTNDLGVRQINAHTHLRNIYIIPYTVLVCM